VEHAQRGLLIAKYGVGFRNLVGALWIDNTVLLDPALEIVQLRQSVGAAVLDRIAESLACLRVQSRFKLPGAVEVPLRLIPLLAVVLRDFGDLAPIESRGDSSQNCPHDMHIVGNA
jgi:hypothetical protein